MPGDGHDTQSKRFKETKTHDLNGPGSTETDVAVPECCGVPDAVRGPQVLRIDDPGTAPHHPQGTVAPSSLSDTASANKQIIARRAAFQEVETLLGR